MVRGTKEYVGRTSLGRLSRDVSEQPRAVSTTRLARLRQIQQSRCISDQLKLEEKGFRLREVAVDCGPKLASETKEIAHDMFADAIS